MSKLRHNIFAILLIALLPTATINAMEVEATDYNIEQDIQSVSIAVNGKTINIKNADKLVLTVYSITGESVYTLRIDSPSKSIDLNQLPSGCYIIKVGNTARKVYLK